MSLSRFEGAVQQRIRMVWLCLLVSGLFLLWFSEFSEMGLAFDFWVSRQFFHGSGRFGENDTNNDGFLDNPKGKQLNITNR